MVDEFDELDEFDEFISTNFETLLPSRMQEKQKVIIIDDNGSVFHILIDFNDHGQKGNFQIKATSLKLFFKISGLANQTKKTKNKFKNAKTYKICITGIGYTENVYFVLFLIVYFYQLSGTTDTVTFVL